MCTHGDEALGELEGWVYVALGRVCNKKDTVVGHDCNVLAIEEWSVVGKKWSIYSRCVYIYNMNIYFSKIFHQHPIFYTHATLFSKKTS
jgi:hypothetical protein